MDLADRLDGNLGGRFDGQLNAVGKELLGQLLPLRAPGDKGEQQHDSANEDGGKDPPERAWPCGSGHGTSGKDRG